MAEKPTIIELNPQKTIAAAVSAAKAHVNAVNAHAGGGSSGGSSPGNSGRGKGQGSGK